MKKECLIFKTFSFYDFRKRVPWLQLHLTNLVNHSLQSSQIYLLPGHHQLGLVVRLKKTWNDLDQYSLDALMHGFFPSRPFPFFFVVLLLGTMSLYWRERFQLRIGHISAWGMCASFISFKAKHQITRFHEIFNSFRYIGVIINFNGRNTPKNRKARYEGSASLCRQTWP